MVGFCFFFVFPLTQTLMSALQRLTIATLTQHASIQLVILRVPVMEDTMVTE